MSTRRQQDVVYPHSGILFGNKKKGYTDTCNSVHSETTGLSDRSRSQKAQDVGFLLYETSRRGKSIEVRLPKAKNGGRKEGENVKVGSYFLKVMKMC